MSKRTDRRSRQCVTLIVKHCVRVVRRFVQRRFRTIDSDAAETPSSYRGADSLRRTIKERKIECLKVQTIDHDSV